MLNDEIFEMNPLDIRCVIVTVHTCTQMSHAGPLIVHAMYKYVSYDVASGSEITPCNKIDKPLMVYRYLREML